MPGLMYEGNCGASVKHLIKIVCTPAVRLLGIRMIISIAKLFNIAIIVSITKLFI